MNADLELARAVFPERTWYAADDRKGVSTSIGFCDDGDFDPKGEHFADVLAWLLSGGCVSIHSASVLPYECVHGPEVHVDTLDGRTVVYKHDGTPSGIKEAVYQAALRVVGGVE